VLQDRQFEPVGSNKTKTVDTRILLASNQNLEKEVKEGRFREDLYYRINTITVDLPPLSDRVGDIELLAKHFLRIYCIQHKREKLGITEETFEYLEHYSWPGNIRELENVIERGVLLSKGKYISLEDLPSSIKQNQSRGQEDYEPMSLKELLSGPEKDFIRQALEANHWNRQETARALQINRTTLFKKMKHYGLYDEAERLGLT
jgi:DNA-binding NtrC family response regulator